MQDHVTLEEWISFVFDHPVTDPSWYFSASSPLLHLDPADAAGLIAATFERAGELLHGFSDAQLNQGLWFLVMAGNSPYMGALIDSSVPWELRRRALRSFVPLFRDVLAARCTPTLSHLSEGGSPLNAICYMWWDVIIISEASDDEDDPEAMMATLPTRSPQAQRLEGEVMAVLVALLAIPHDACRESAIHGLGHWALTTPQAVAVLEAFLARTPELRPELVAYARGALTGCVL